MKYEIVQLERKIVVGVSGVTANSDPKMFEIIGGLWNKLYQTGVSESVKNKKNAYAIGLYSDYVAEQYEITVGHEVLVMGNENLSHKIIPEGRYAKFAIEGKMQEIVGQAWKEIWQMDLDRSFTGDFEEYLNCDGDQAKINIYIALNE